MLCCELNAVFLPTGRGIDIVADRVGCGPQGCMSLFALLGSCTVYLGTVVLQESGMGF